MDGHGLSMSANYFYCCNCEAFFQFPQISEGKLKEYYEKYYRYGETLSTKRGSSCCVSFRKILDRMLNAAFGRLLPVSGGLRLLDIGCGDGDFLQQVRERYDFKELYGIEPTRALYERAKLKQGIKVINKPFELSNFSNEYFDVITFYHVFEHLRNPLITLNKVREWLRPHGIVVIQVPNSKALMIKIFGKYCQLFASPAHFFLFPRKSFKVLSEMTGFKVLRFRKIILPESWELSLNIRLTGFEEKCVLPSILRRIVRLFFVLIEILLSFF